MITLNIYSGKRHHIVWKHSGLWFQSLDVLTETLGLSCTLQFPQHEPFRRS